MKKKLELLSPAGSFGKLKTALAFGADAVYAGIPDFSLRVRINDFDFPTIARATEYCHNLHKKIYVTVNIFAHNRHLVKLSDYIEKLKAINVDALIVSDPGVFDVIKDYWPDCEIHLSTQANVTNWRAVCFWQKQGVKRIILGREVALKDIEEIHKRCPEIELEYFVHGAMCMAYSGRCFLSAYLRGRSANLGDCAQPCRWQYDISDFSSISSSITPRGEQEGFELVEEKHGSYILNSHDLNLLRYLKKLEKVGISSFKIEGRAKSTYYQAVVAGVYASALRNLKDKVKIAFLAEELENKLMHRGYTKGFLFDGRAGENISNSHKICSWEFCGEVIESINVSENKKSDNKFKVYFKVHNSIKIGDRIEIIRPLYDIIKLQVDKLFDKETDNMLKEAHGGQNKIIYFFLSKEIPKYSVIRRKVT